MMRERIVKANQSVGGTVRWVYAELCKCLGERNRRIVLMEG